MLVVVVCGLNINNTHDVTECPNHVLLSIMLWGTNKLETRPHLDDVQDCTHAHPRSRAVDEPDIFILTMVLVLGKCQEIIMKGLLTFHRHYCTL